MTPDLANDQERQQEHKTGAGHEHPALHAPAGAAAARGGKQQGGGETLLADPDATAEFLARYANYGRNAFYGHPDESFAPVGNPAADGALLDAFAAGQEIMKARADTKDSTGAAIAAFDLWSAGRPLADRAVASLAANPAYAEIAAFWRRELRSVDGKLASMRAQETVHAAGEGGHGAGEDAFLEAHKEVLIQALEEARESGNAALKLSDLPSPEEKVGEMVAHAHVPPGMEKLHIGVKTLDRIIGILQVPDIMEELHKGGLKTVSSIAELFEYAVETAKDVVVTIVEVSAVIARKSFPHAAEQLEHLTGKIEALKGLRVLGAVTSILSIATSTQELIEAIEKGDERGIIHGAGGIAMGGTGLAATFGIPGANLATITIYLWMETADALGRLGGALAELRQHAALEKVWGIVQTGRRLTSRGIQLATAWQGMLDAQNADRGQDGMQGDLSNAFSSQSARAVEEIHAVVAQLGGELGQLPPELSGAFGAAAAQALGTAAECNDPALLTNLCTKAVCPGIEALVHTALKVEGTLSPQNFAKLLGQEGESGAATPASEPAALAR